MASTDPAEVEELLWTGWQGSTALDVGARRGESIADLSSCGFTDITCFEPAAKAYEFLSRNALALDVTVVHGAVSDHDGEVQLAVTAAMQKGELVSPIDGMEWSEDWSQATYVTVPCITLDTWCYAWGMPDLVKVDTEGHEDKVLAGAQTLLRQGCGWLIEFHSPQNHAYCLNQLDTYGYEFKTIRHPHYAPESPMWYQHGWIRGEQKGAR